MTGWKWLRRCLFLHCCLKSWYNVTVLCPESQNRAPQSLCLLHISQLHLLSSLITDGFRASLCVSARQGLGAVTQSPYLPSFVLKTQDNHTPDLPPPAFSTLPQEVISATIQGHCPPLLQQVLCPFMLDAPCTRSRRRSIMHRSTILTTIGILIELWLFTLQYLNCLRSGNSEINSKLVLTRKRSIHRIREIHRIMNSSCPREISTLLFL